MKDMDLAEPEVGCESMYVEMVRDLCVVYGRALNEGRWHVHTQLSRCLVNIFASVS
jgi:hypothetical protein